ncbi:zinc-binding alcohol dehydrogenase family protein [Dactylosporangium aurantiacum]|uniref:Zinc-binding alcohol dehydrogenase family protein n=1 Tax=Dactylosporangium aurantiacum TaxID=35754 RepID=A0A9Q9MIJ3_9ACTN|nr:zinc-binding alcohol dehydrogenase family protein [Dactylosporangium aurantiacum]MDG6105833.1 zinc-binding alcohol dehydrogenase family protein [Dactylosporangium aurantiacum]UWZ57984.1 zinc-binding alcohol dehydrogenase family protein [Dactylosporangium aurantiacum]
MHAAVITAFDAPPSYREHPEPVAAGEHDLVVDVLAAGLHHLTRAKANGSHYSSTGALPLVPGADAVVRDAQGRLRYAALDDTPFGTFADRTVIDERRSVVLPDEVDPVRIAAAMNPAMSSWVALRRRIDFRPGGRVLILGATGNAGRMAVQIAKLLGAAHVTAAGRDPARLAALPALGADQTVTFDQIERAADADVVIDYVWGEPSAGAMIPLLTARTDRGAPLTWIQIGSLAGRTAPIPSAALRAARLQLVGSGIGSVPARHFLEELPALAAAVTRGEIDVRARAVPLAEVSHAWTTAATDERIVFVP